AARGAHRLWPLHSFWSPARPCQTHLAQRRDAVHSEQPLVLAQRAVRLHVPALGVVLQQQRADDAPARRAVGRLVDDRERLAALDRLAQGRQQRGDLSAVGCVGLLAGGGRRWRPIGGWHARRAQGRAVRRGAAASQQRQQRQERQGQRQQRRQQRRQHSAAHLRGLRLLRRH